MWLINKNDKPPTLHGSKTKRDLAVTGGKLARIKNDHARGRSQTGRRGFDSRPGANSPRGGRRPASKSTWW